MIIGIDIRTLMESQYSGVSEYTLNLVRELIEQNPDDKFKLFYNSAKNVDDKIPEFNNDNVEIVKTRYPNKVFNFFLQKILGWPKIDKILGVDIFIAPNIGFYALSNDCKKILVIHDLSFLRYKEFFSWKRRLWHRVINVKKLAKKFDKIVAVSENTAGDLNSLCGVKPGRIKVVYSGISSNFEFRISNFELERVRNKYKLPDKFILNLGTVEPRKNVQGLIQAYNEMRDARSEMHDVKLVIAGGRGWKSKNIYKEWDESKYKDDIIFLGYVDNEDKAGIYKLASVFVYPSFYEGFGFPPLEAMTVGTSVITSNTSSLSEVVGEAAIMVDPYNVKDLSLAMENVLSDENLREALVEKGFKQVKKFDWAKTAEDFKEILLNC